MPVLVKESIISQKDTDMWKLSFLIVMGIVFCFSFLEDVYGANKSVIVGFHRTPGTYEKNIIRKARGRIKRTFGKVRAMSVTLDEKEIERLKRDSINVAYIEEDAVMSAIDPIVSQEYIDSWGVAHIGSENVHLSGNRGEGVKIAVLDTGIDYTHDDLQDNYRGGYDFVFGDDDPYDDSSRSHGTHIAGIIGAQDNGSGVVGVAPGADIYAVKVLDGGGFGLLSWLIEGIEWSIDNGMDIINLSLEGRDFQSLRDACDSAYSAGILIVSASGNTSGGEVRYPAAYDSVIAVTGTDADDMQGYFSPIGPEIELAAPGVDILSSIANWNYETLSGTSQAAAHVTGAAALFLASDLEDVNGDSFVDNRDLRQVLQSTATDLGGPGPDNVYGYGRIDVTDASFQEFETILLTLERNSRSPRDDTQSVTLSGAVYEIDIENHGLRGIKMAVYEGDVFVKELSRKYRLFPWKRHRFVRRKSRERTIVLDARNKEYDVNFTPYGRRGRSADLTITEK